MLDTSIQIKTENFDGPMALLLFLIEKEEMNIRDLNLTKITKQYLDYLASMQDLNFDVAGEYLYLAATLILLKSKAFLTEEDLSALKNGSESSDFYITSQAELIRRLEELQHFQKVAQKLWERPRKGEQIFTRPKIDRKAIIDSILTPIDLEQLTLAMIGLIQKEKRKYTVLKRDRLSIKEKLEFLKQYLSLGQKTDFSTLLDQDGGSSIDNIVITFISILELSRLKKLNIYQNEESSTIYIEVIQRLDDFDVNVADGFEAEQEAGETVPLELPRAEGIENDDSDKTLLQ